MRPAPLFLFISTAYLRYHTHLPWHAVAKISLDEYRRKEIDISYIEMYGGTFIYEFIHMTIHMAVLIDTLKDIGSELHW